MKSNFGWQADYLIWKDSEGNVDAAALILLKEIEIPLFHNKFKTIYIPQGPLLDWSNKSLRDEVLKDISVYAQENRAFSVKIDPEIIYCVGENVDKDDGQFQNTQHIRSDLKEQGWIYSTQQVQFRNTAWIDLTKSEDDLLSNMKQKTRYNIRIAEKKGVVVRQAGLKDLDVLYNMYLETSNRDNFIIRPKEYYTKVWSIFIKAGLAVPLIAKVDEDPIASLVLFYLGSRSWYIYGMSTKKHREKMPNYLLQWEAIKLSKDRGCRIYDLWGAPEIFGEEDELWGVYRFKKGLGCEVVQRLGAYDLPINKVKYKLFNKAVPSLLSITRKIRGIQQKKELT